MTVLDIVDTYEPFEKQDLAHRAGARHLLFGGAVGPGKTRFLVEHIKATMLKWPGIPILLGRYNLIDLERTTLREWHRHVDPRLWDPKFGGRFDANENAYYFPNGSSLTATSMKDWERHMSAEYGMIAFEELSEIPELVYNNLETRLRWTTGEGDCQRPACLALDTYHPHPVHPLYQMVSACNPTPRWPKARWYDRWAAGTLPPSHAFIQALTRDNPRLPPDYIPNLMENNNPTWVRRMLDGDWTAFEGATFANFTRARNMWPSSEPFRNLLDGQPYGGIDWGATTTYAHRTAATLTGRLRCGALLTFWEYSKQGPAAKDFFSALRTQTKMWRSAGWFADTSQSRAIEALNESSPSLSILPANNEAGSRADGINLMARLFEGTCECGEHASLMIHESCTHLLSGIETYHEVPETNATSGFGPVGTDPVRRDDDEVDAERYNVDGMNRLRPVVTNLDLQVSSPRRGPNAVRTSSILEFRRQMREQRLQQVLQNWDGDY